MKRIRAAALLLTLAICLTLAASAEEDEAQVFRAEGFCLTVPADWGVFTEDLEPEEIFEIEGRLVSPDYGGLVLEVGPVPADGFVPAAEWVPGNAEACADMMLKGLEAWSPELVDTVRAQEIPIPVVHVVDDEGPCCWACATAGERIIALRAFVIDPTSELRMELSEDNLEQLGRILAGFRAEP